MKRALGTRVHVLLMPGFQLEFIMRSFFLFFSARISMDGKKGLKQELEEKRGGGRSSHQEIGSEPCTST